MRGPARSIHHYPSTRCGRKVGVCAVGSAGVEPESEHVSCQSLREKVGGPLQLVRCSDRSRRTNFDSPPSGDHLVVRQGLANENRSPIPFLKEFGCHCARRHAIDAPRVDLPHSCRPPFDSSTTASKLPLWLWSPDLANRDRRGWSF